MSVVITHSVEVEETMKQCPFQARAERGEVLFKCAQHRSVFSMTRNSREYPICLFYTTDTLAELQFISNLFPHMKNLILNYNLTIAISFPCLHIHVSDPICCCLIKIRTESLEPRRVNPAAEN